MSQTSVETTNDFIKREGLDWNHDNKPDKSRRRKRFGSSPWSARQFGRELVQGSVTGRPNLNRRSHRYNRTRRKIIS